VHTIWTLNSTGGAIAAAHIAYFFAQITEAYDGMMIIAVEVMVRQEAQAAARAGTRGRALSEKYGLFVTLAPAGEPLIQKKNPPTFPESFFETCVRMGSIGEFMDCHFF
jgi:hypothetical protein